MHEHCQSKASSFVASRTLKIIKVRAFVDANCHHLSEQGHLPALTRDGLRTSADSHFVSLWRQTCYCNIKLWSNIFSPTAPRTAPFAFRLPYFFDSGMTLHFRIHIPLHQFNQCCLYDFPSFCNLFCKVNQPSSSFIERPCLLIDYHPLPIPIPSIMPENLDMFHVQIPNR